LYYKGALRIKLDKKRKIRKKKIKKREVFPELLMLEQTLMSEVGGRLRRRNSAGVLLL